jgi:hypothetical protein
MLFRGRRCEQMQEAWSRRRLTWRLNSINWVYQQILQVCLYAEVKGRVCPAELKTLVHEGWHAGGKDKFDKKKLANCLIVSIRKVFASWVFARQKLPK